MTKTKSIIYCGLFTALIAVGAFIKIPIPVVPFTLQYLFTMLAGLLLGSRRGSLSVIAYVILGLAGLPIFSEGGGLWYIFKPSFGYLIGFCAGTFLTGYLAEHMKKKTVLVHPCPKCGSNFLAHGKPYGCTTPRILAWLGSLHGVICVSCGHYAPTVKAWNREWEKKK